MRIKHSHIHKYSIFISTLYSLFIPYPTSKQTAAAGFWSAVGMDWWAWWRSLLSACLTL